MFTAHLAQMRGVSDCARRAFLKNKGRSVAHVTVAAMRPRVKLDAAALQAFRELGRIGGKKGGPKGGKARMAKLTEAQRRGLARKAARARWARDRAK